MDRQGQPTGVDCHDREEREKNLQQSRVKGVPINAQNSNDPKHQHTAAPEPHPTKPGEKDEDSDDSDEEDEEPTKQGKEQPRPHQKRENEQKETVDVPGRIRHIHRKRHLPRDHEVKREEPQEGKEKEEEEAAGAKEREEEAKGHKEKEEEAKGQQDKGGEANGGKKGQGARVGRGPESGAEFHGEGTFYTPDVGACGHNNEPTDMICAISMIRYGDSSSEANPNCGRPILATYNGASVRVTVADCCENCAEDDLDFSPSAFQKLADPSAGRIKITWHFE